MALQPALSPQLSEITARPRLRLELNNLNPEQLAVVTADPDAHQAILAGAGTGKTRALTVRIAWLIEQGVEADRIIALTFTNKAARELRERLTSLLGKTKAQGLQTGTFHSIGLRWLKQYGKVLGLQGSQIHCLDPDDTEALVRRHMKPDPYWQRMEMKPRDAQVALFKYKRGLYVSAMENDNWPERTPEYRALGLDRDLDSPVHRLYQRYETEKAQNSVLDFEDLLLLPHRLFAQSPQVLGRLQAELKQVLVDEFQDTDHFQYALLARLSQVGQPWKGGPRFTVVGDDDQSLYSWRGATTDVFNRYLRDSGAELRRLEQNYRCSPLILQAANAVIDHNSDRLGKKLYTTRTTGTKLRFEAYTGNREEATAVLRQVQDYLAGGGKPSDIAILYRKKRFSSDLEAAFFKAGIPYRVYGGLDFYRREEVKHALAFLRLIAHPEDNLAFRRVVNIPPRKFGSAKLEALEEFAETWGLSLYAAARSSDSPARHLVQTLDQLRDAWNDQSPAIRDLGTLVQNCLRDTRLLDWYRLEQKDKEKGEIQADRLLALVEHATQFQSRVTADGDTENLLSDYLAESMLEAEATAASDRPAVSLMTVHKAKGLEFPVVFMMALEEGEFPDGKAPVEEERRLFYVGLTRARDHLYLSHADKRFAFGEVRPAFASRFLQELPSPVMDLKTPLAQLADSEESIPLLS